MTGPKQNKSALNEELAPAQKAQVAKFNNIVGTINKVAAAPRFRKAISVLNHRTAFIEATIQLPAFNAGEGSTPQEYNWDFFEIPYNNIEGVELKTEGGIFNVDLKFSDNSFVFARNLILKLQAIASSGDFGGTPKIRLRWGWSDTGLNKTPKRQAQPIVQNVLFFELTKVTADTDLTKEAYTFSGQTIQVPPGLHSGMWRPFSYFGPRPLLDFAWSNFYDTAKDLNKTLNDLGRDKVLSFDRTLADAIKNKKEDDLTKGRSGGKLTDFIIKLKKDFGVENYDSIRKIISGVFDLNSASAAKVNEIIGDNKINTEDFKIISNINKNDDKDIFVKVNKASPKKMADIIANAIDNKSISDMTNQLFPIMGELNVNAYDALCHCIAGMLEQNSQINRLTPNNKNKIFFLNFVSSALIEDIKKDPKLKDAVKDKLRVSAVNCSKYSTWQKLLTDISNSITIAPGGEDTKKTPAQNSEAQNSKHLSFIFKTYNKNLNKSDIEKVTKIIELIYATSSLKSNDLEVSRVGDEVKKEIQRVIDDPSYENITFVMISEKDIGALFNHNNWGNRIFQSYSTKPLKKKGDLIFNSGTVSMSDEGFPDVISFKPTLNFDTVRQGILFSADSARSTKTGSMSILDQNNNKIAREEKINSIVKEKKISKEEAAKIVDSDASKIVNDNRTQSVNVNDFRDITTPLNITDSMVGDSFIDFKRKETNMRKMFAQQMVGAIEADLQIIGEPAWDEALMNGIPNIYFKHYTTSGTLSEYSGVYRVLSVTHSISAGKFTTNLKIKKEALDPNDPFNNNQVMSNNIAITPVNNDGKTEKQVADVAKSKSGKSGKLTGPLAGAAARSRGMETRVVVNSNANETTQSA